MNDFFKDEVTPLELAMEKIKRLEHELAEVKRIAAIKLENTAWRRLAEAEQRLEALEAVREAAQLAADDNWDDPEESTKQNLKNALQRYREVIGGG